MTPKKMRIVIAQAMGWKKVPDKYYTDKIAFERDGQRCSSVDFYYTEDLNECRKLEMSFSEPDFSEYYDELVNVVQQSEEWASSTLSARRMVARSTALQRCEAFLKTKGLWES